METFERNERYIRNKEKERTNEKRTTVLAKIVELETNESFGEEYLKEANVEEIYWSEKCKCYVISHKEQGNEEQKKGKRKRK